MQNFPKYFQAHNQRYLNGLETFWMRINTFSDKTPEEFSQSFLGIPPFTNGTIRTPPKEGTRGELPVNFNPPPAVDGESGCGTPVTQQLDGCNSCGVHSVINAAELCLCRAGGELLGPRSRIQTSWCSDGKGLDLDNPPVNIFLRKIFED